MRPVPSHEIVVRISVSTAGLLLSVEIDSCGEIAREREDGKSLFFSTPVVGGGRDRRCGAASPHVSLPFGEGLRATRYTCIYATWCVWPSV